MIKFLDELIKILDEVIKCYCNLGVLESNKMLLNVNNIFHMLGHRGLLYYAYGLFIVPYLPTD